MKKIILTVTMGILLMSCSNEPTALETSTTAKVAPTSKTLIIGSTTIPAADYSLFPYVSCIANCIAAESSTYFEKTDSKIVSWGGLNNDKFSKTIYIKYFNTRTEFKLLVLSTEKFADLVINGASVGVGAAANTWGEYSIPLESGWKACDIKSLYLQVVGDGPQGVFDINYSLVGMCASGCETVFSGKAISCSSSREAEYTFTPKDAISNLKIQGGLTNFTGTNATVTVTGGTLTVSQSTPGGSSNRIIKVEGSVSACEKVTINIKWNSSNSGTVITGDWSANGIGLTVDPILGLECIQ
ncbi:hypothetical protein [Flavobacterium sp. ACAM 123]|jgi:hypothetical protein|uniref:hypothetical protein n=1 Tax=Flavobacterium sp. ACAM 123 TaxID=1189620 RepID=UPI0003757198|nr:hypothetical protein [Flavobacterium sp. ACAM 123]